MPQVGAALFQSHGCVIAGARVEGSIMMDDTDLNNPEIDPVLLRAQVGMVFQKPIRFRNRSSRMLPTARIHGLASSKDELDHIVTDSLKRAGLWSEVSDRLNDKATGLSGGQQQRLCIARAIAVSPLCCHDRPCSALDPSPLR